MDAMASTISCSSIFLRRIIGSMFMRVNSRCAHQGAPTTGGPEERLSYRTRSGIIEPAGDGTKSARTQTAGPNMISPPASWADADDLPKGSRERGLIGKTCTVRNFGE